LLEKPNKPISFKFFHLFRVASQLYKLIIIKHSDLSSSMIFGIINFFFPTFLWLRQTIDAWRRNENFLLRVNGQMNKWKDGGSQLI
jgi:hypothetical protein